MMWWWSRMELKQWELRWLVLPNLSNLHLYLHFTCKSFLLLYCTQVPICQYLPAPSLHFTCYFNCTNIHSCAFKLLLPLHKHNQQHLKNLPYLCLTCAHVLVLNMCTCTCRNASMRNLASWLTRRNWTLFKNCTWWYMIIMMVMKKQKIQKHIIQRYGRNVNDWHICSKCDISGVSRIVLWCFSKVTELLS